MRKRILAAAICIILATTVVLIVFVGYILQRQRKGTAQQSIQAVAAVLAGGFTSFGEYTDYANIVSDLTGYRITVVAADGTLLDDSAELAGDSNFLEREEFIQAGVSGTGLYIRESSFGRRTMYAVALASDGTYIRVASEFVGFWGNLATELPFILLAVLVMALVVVWLSRVFTRTISQPMQDFSLSLDRVMEGGEKLLPDRYPYEELQGMALAINHLTDEVEQGIKRVEKEHMRVETILDTMKEGFILLDWEEEVVLINDTACRILGFVKGTGYDNLVFVTRDIGILNAVAEVKKTGTVRQVEYGAANGSYYEVTVSPTAPDPDKGTQGVAIILSDVGDHLSTAKIRQDFFASASHELKTPITSVRGFAELLNVEGELPGEMRKEYAGRIMREAQRMQTLIEDILMIARMESGELRYEREDLDFFQLVESSCEDAAALASGQGVEMDFRGEPCRLYASRKEMLELVGNLTSNAVKYNTEKGVIRVRLWQEEGNTMLSVYNTGVPIPETSTERIFERFYRVDKGRSKAVGGTGLGLAIVKHIAGMYGAKVSVIPGPEGNTFQVIFPPSVGVRMY